MFRHFKTMGQVTFVTFAAIPSAITGMQVVQDASVTVPGTTEKSSQNTKRPSTHLVISRKESIIESLTSDRLLTGMVAGLVPGDSPLRPASRTRGGGGRSSLRTCGPKQHTTTTACKVTTTTPTPCIGYTRSNTTHYSRGTTPAGVMGARGGGGKGIGFGVGLTGEGGRNRESKKKEKAI